MITNETSGIASSHEQLESENKSLLDLHGEEEDEHGQHDEEMLYRIEFQWQTWVIGSLAIVANLLLLFVLYKQKKSLLGSYQLVLYYTTVMNMCFALVIGLTLPSIHIHAGAVFIVSGNDYLPAHYEKFLILIFMFFFIQSSILFTLVFANRCITMSLSRKSIFHKPRARLFMILLTYLVLFAWLALTAVTMWPETPEEIDIKSESEFAELATLSADIKTCVLFWPILLFLLVILSFSFTSQLFFVLLLFRTLGKLQQNDVNRSITSLIVYQTCVPVICLHLPIYLSVILPMIGFSDDRFLLLLPFLFVWFPLVDPLLILCRVTSFRTTVILTFLTLIGRPPPTRLGNPFPPIKRTTSTVIKF